MWKKDRHPDGFELAPPAIRHRNQEHRWQPISKFLGWNSFGEAQDEWYTLDLHFASGRSSAGETFAGWGTCQSLSPAGPLRPETVRPEVGGLTGHAHRSGGVGD